MMSLGMIEAINESNPGALTRPSSGGSRNSERGFQLIVDPKRRGLGVQPPAAEEVSIFKSIQSNEKFNIFPIDNSKLWLATLTYSS